MRDAGVQTGCDRLLGRGKLHDVLLAVETRQDLDDLRLREQIAGELKRDAVEFRWGVERRSRRLSNVFGRDQGKLPIRI